MNSRHVSSQVKSLPQRLKRIQSIFQKTKGSIAQGVLPLTKIQIMSKAKIQHPGKILKKDFLDPKDISTYRLSRDIFVPQTRMSEIINGRRSVSADTALRLSKYFGNEASYWMALQSEYDLQQTRIQKKDEIAEIKKLKTSKR